MYRPPIHKQAFHKGRRAAAKMWLKAFSDIPIVGITGSYGKTTTTKAVVAVLSKKYQVLTTDTNLDTVYNLPITMLQLRGHHQQMVLEYGIDHLGEMDEHIDLVQPHIGVLTGITPVHTDAEHMGSLENLVAEKARLLQRLPEGGVAIANYDNKYVREIAERLKAERGHALDVISYGTRGAVDYKASKIQVTTEGTTFTIQAPEWSGKMGIGLVGKHFAQQALVGTIIGELQDVSQDDILTALEEMEPMQGRMNIETGPRGLTVLNDSKRSNPESARSGLETFDALKVSGQKIAVLGEMGEIDERIREEEHRKVGEYVGKSKIDMLVAIGPLMQHAADGAISAGMKKSAVFAVANVHEAADVLNKKIKKGDAMYLKGSLLRHMERILLLLDGSSVGCEVVSCPFYRHCQECEYLEEGYKA